MNDENSNWQTIYRQSSTDGTGTMPNQNNYPQINTDYLSGTATFDAERIAKKIKFWRRLSVILGLVSFFSHLILFIVMIFVAHVYGGHALLVVSFFGSMISGSFFRVLLVLSIVTLIRVIKLSAQRKMHVFKDYVVTIVGILVAVFSPFIISGISSSYSIEWDEDDSMSVIPDYHIA